MPSEPLKRSARVQELFHINQFKFFCQEFDYVACFGEPAAANDGWILNLPASHVFEREYHTLPFEVRLDAIAVHNQAVVRDPLSRYLSLDLTGTPWAARASRFVGPKYERADLLRDISSILGESGQFLLALDFIEKAHELRPKGPLIAKMLAELKLKCRSLQ